jgi:Zn-dependent protease with chaperone function
MTPPLPRRRSLAVLALLGLAMVAISYAVIMFIAATCVYLPFLVIMSSESPGFQTIVLLVCGVGMAGTMLWSLVPRRDKFQDPGPKIDPSAHPRLFAELESIATALNEPLPTEVFLVPEVNAFVTDRGGIMGFGSRRIMGIGLPLVAVLNVAEFRAVLAHEFAHYYGGDTRLGPFVYKTRQAMIRTIQNMASIGGVMRIAIAQIIHRVVMWILQGYWKVFFRATQLISRRQEYRADELACHVAGSEALISGLKKIHGGNAAFPAYWNFEVTPFLGNGYRPAITEGFELFVMAPEISAQIEQNLGKALAQSKTTPYDSHPPLRDRIDAAKLFPSQQFGADSDAPARSLFNDLPREEARILSLSTSESQVAALKPLAWNELPSILPKLWSDTVRSNAQVLGELTPEAVPDVVSKLSAIGSQIPDPKGMLLSPEQRTGRAAELIGTALALAVVNAGWRLHMSPGERYYEIGDERFSVRQFLGQLLSKKISREEWVERCHTLKIAGVPLAGTNAPAGQMKMFDATAKS